MKPRLRFSWLLWFVLATSVPAYADNPVAPFSMLALLMIFPVVILGLRWAGAKLPQEARISRMLKGIGLGLAYLMIPGPGVPGWLGLLIMLCYGLWRGVQVMRFGQGSKRCAIGGAVMLFTLFAMGDYGPGNWDPLLIGEADASHRVGNIATAERTLQSSGVLDVNKNGIGEYGTLEQLVQAHLLQGDFLFGGAYYRYVVVLSGDPDRDEKQFLVYATPTNYREYPWWLHITLLRRLGPPLPRYAKRTFASDETGVTRRRDLGGSRAVTREEVQNWPEP